MITLETDINFTDDPWSVPPPSIENVQRIPGLKTRYLWYAPLHITEYPVLASSIEIVSKKSGYHVPSSQIGNLMRKLCMRGYFSRNVYHRGSSGPYYKYTPTPVFIRIQDEWRNGGA